MYKSKRPIIAAVVSLLLLSAIVLGNVFTLLVRAEEDGEFPAAEAGGEEQTASEEEEDDEDVEEGEEQEPEPGDGDSTESEDSEDGEETGEAGNGDGQDGGDGAQPDEENSDEEEAGGGAPCCGEEGCSAEGCERCVDGEGCVLCEDCRGCTLCEDCVLCEGCECGGGELLTDAMALYEMDGQWAVVTNEAGLVKALAEKEAFIRLGADVTVRNNLMNVSHSVTLDGEKPGGGRWKLDTNRVFILRESDLTFVAQNLNVVTSNVYGLVGIESYSTVSGADVYIRYCNYDGPQVAYLRNDGTLYLHESDFIIGSDEVGECTQFILSGSINIQKTGGNSLFWIYNYGPNDRRQGLLRFEDDARVYISSRDAYLLWREAGVDGVDILDIEVGNRVTLEITTALGWSYESARYADNFTIGASSTVTMTRNGRSLEVTRPLYIERSMSVGPGSTLIIEASDYPALYLRGSNVSITLDDPELVRLDRHITGNAPGSVTMTGKAFNAWTTAQNHQTDKPETIVNAPNGELVTVSIAGGNASAGYTDAQSGAWVPLDGAAALNPCGNQSLRSFSMGRYELEVDDFSFSSTALTGAMSTNAALRATFYVRGAQSAQTVAAVRDAAHDRDGLYGFSVHSDETVANGFSQTEPAVFSLARGWSAAGIITRATQLWAVEERLPSGGLYLADVPEVLQFGPRAIPGLMTYFPLMEDAIARVIDTRTDAATVGWQLIAQAGQLRNDSSGRALDADAIGFMDGGVFWPLSGGYVVWSGDRDLQNAQQEKHFAAGDDGGLVVRVDPYSAEADRYQTQVVWTLAVGP